MLDSLGMLVRRLEAVAVISGRDTALLARWLPIPGLRLYGNHGLEERHHGRSRLAAPVRPHLASLRAVTAALRALPETRAGRVQLEVKRAVVSLHYRSAPENGVALQPQLGMLAERHHLVLVPGRLVWEFRPPVAVDKGTIVHRLVEELDPAGVIFVGDDVSDRPAFEALAQLAGRTTLAVGVASRETPPDVFAACDLVLPNAAAVPRLLSDLARWSGSRAKLG